MIPTTIFELIDKSQIPQPKKETVKRPLFLTGISSDKGPEDIRIVSGDLFYKLYGKNISFARHGQPLLQASRVIDAGGALLVKRVVDDEATLANIVIVATLSKTNEQKRNDRGEFIYKNPSGQETTDPVDNEPVMVDMCNIKYECKSITGVKDLYSAAAIANSILDDAPVDGGTYPLAIITDNGRGLSGKKFRISPLYDASRYLNYIKYSIEVIEDDQVIETLTFTLNPDITEGSINKSLQNMISTYSNQLKAKVFEDSYRSFVDKVAVLSSNTIEYCNSSDLLFAKERKLQDLNNIRLDSTGFNLSYIYGIYLENGSNGRFEDAPVTKTEYSNQLVKFFNGTFDDIVFDVDAYKIDAIVDCNYPLEVKRAIENLVSFREDCSYFRDLGLGLSTLEDILSSNVDYAKGKYCFTYHNSYDVIDPYTKKQITVTIGYSLAPLLVRHILGGVSRPFAGQLYGITIPEAIPGTINFIPKVTPSENQKQVLNDNRINYISSYDEVLTVETLYTSQENYTQLSFINNILAVQEVIKAVRTKCPKIRYSFIDGQDLENYKRDVQTVLDKYTSNFKKLSMTYIADPEMTTNKIYYASIEVVFRDFVQTEYFKLFAL